MQIICSNCNTSYNIPDNKIPAKKSFATCKKCGNKIAIDPVQTDHTEQSIPPEPPPQQPEQKPVIEKTEILADQQMSADYPELKKLSAEKYDLEEILTRNKKGGYKNRKNRLKVRILNTVSDKLDKILSKDEKVLHIGKGTAHYPAEIFFGNGLLTMMYNHYAIVCTNQKILFININSRITKTTHYLFQMSYEEIKKVRRSSFFAGLSLYPKKGKRRHFTYVKRFLAKEIMAFIKTKIVPGKQETASEAFDENLCPSCFVPLKKGLIRCPACKADFKIPKTAMLRSLILPGLGDIYLGHKWLGGFEIFGAVIVWVFIISLLLDPKPETIGVAIFFLLIVNGFDGLLTYHMAKKGYMLAEVD